MLISIGIQGEIVKARMLENAGVKIVIIAAGIMQNSAPLHRRMNFDVNNAGNFLKNVNVKNPPHRSSHDPPHSCGDLN